MTAVVSPWWLIACVIVGGFWLVAATLAWIVERALRRKWEKRARRTRAEVIDLTGFRPEAHRSGSRFGQEPAGGTKISARDRAW